MSPSNISGSTDASRDSRRTTPTTTLAANTRTETPEQPSSPHPDREADQTPQPAQAPDRYDLLVIGGGVNGTGIARDAAGRGLSVLLCEQDDLAAHTSSASTKLIHGGLRYLEDFHFALVRKALLEREVLLNAAPHIMRPLHFVMPHDAHLRPMWMIRAGLFLYDHLAPRKRLAASAEIDLRKHIAGGPLQPRFQRGFVYSDGWTDDARLVVLNALDAAAHGAVIATRTRCTKIEAVSGEWRATLEEVHGNMRGGAAGSEDVPGGGGASIRGRRSVRARVVVNAAGPWVSRFVTESSPVRASHRVRLVKGSHIVVPKLFAHRFAYIFQNEDRRIVFAIPYEREFTLIGTTDVDYHGEPQDVRIDSAEIAYLCAIANRYFIRNIGPADVAWSYSGVRPLVNDEATDPSSVTRDYLLELDREPAPMLSVFGGKITTFRKLAETAVDRLTDVLGSTAGPGTLQGPGRLRGPWTQDATLPGGDLPGGSFAVFLRTVERRYPWLPVALRRRYAQSYGTRIHRVLGNADSLRDLGAELVPQLYEREAEYLCREEFARTAEDILWRRSKLGLHLRGQSTRPLEDWLSKTGWPNSHRPRDLT